MSQHGTKAANTALVRMIRAGKLSPAAIARAAEAMPEGSFRFLKNLGRGQFNVADEVVGSVGGAAGRMVRKLPAHAYADPQDAYKGLKTFIDRTNKEIPTPSGAPLIAPYHDVNSRGAFQAIANQAINTPASIQAEAARRGWQNAPRMAKHLETELPTEAYRKLRDLHEGNIGPGGQIIDFAAPGVGGAPSTARRVASTPINDRVNHIPGGYDALANMSKRTRAQQAQLDTLLASKSRNQAEQAQLAMLQETTRAPAQQAQFEAANNSVRRFYAMPATQRSVTPGVMPRTAGMATHGLEATKTHTPGAQAAQKALHRLPTDAAPQSLGPLDLTWSPWPNRPPPVQPGFASRPVPPKPGPLRRIAPLAVGGAAAAGGVTAADGLYRLFNAPKAPKAPAAPVAAPGAP